MKSLWVVDVCGTLVREDTTIGLLRWHFKIRHKLRYVFLIAASAKLSPIRFIFVAIERLSKKHILKKLLVLMLRGDRYADIEASASSYADWLLRENRVTQVRKLLDARKGGEQLVLASASLAPVVQALAKQLDVDFVASRLEVHDGVCTGRYAHDITGDKIQALQELPGIWPPANYLAVSDNLSDRNLLEGAGRAFVVLHKPRHRSRWEGLDAEYLTL